MSTRHRFVEPQGWAAPIGYAHGVVARGRVIAVSGQIGCDPATQRLVAGDLAAQAGQALRNVAAVLYAAGASPEHTTRLTWYVVDRDAYTASRSELGAVYRAVFGRHYPAMSVVVVAGLLEPGALVEIEATAVIPD